MKKTVDAVGAFADVTNYPIKQIAHPIKFYVSAQRLVAATPKLGADIYTGSFLSDLELSPAKCAMLQDKEASKE